MDHSAEAHVEETEAKGAHTYQRNPRIVTQFIWNPDMKNFSFRLIAKCVCAFSLFVPTLSMAASWFVLPASRCERNGDGTMNVCAASNGSAGAWKGSENIIWSSINPGDTVNFRGAWGASDCHDPLQYCVLIKKSGTVAARITFDFSSSVLDSNFLRAKALETQGNSNLIVKNLTATRFTTYGINMNSGGATTDVLNVTVEAPTISHIAGCIVECAGIRAKGSSVVIHNPRISQIADDGIWTDGDRVEINFDVNDGTYFVKDVGLGPKISGDCFQFSGSGRADKNYVRKGYCDHRSASEKQCVVSNSTGLLTVTDTVCLANSTGGTVGIYSNGRVDLERNLISGWGIGISAAAASTSEIGPSIIASNVINKFDTIGIATGVATPDGVYVIVANNTVDGANSDAINSQCLTLGGGSGSTVEASNNIAVNCRYAYYRAGGTGQKTLNDNLDFGTAFQYYGFSAGSTTSAPRFTGEADLVGQYHLGPLSPALRTGGCYRASGCAFPDHDNVGQSVPPSIGAFGG